MSYYDDGLDKIFLAEAAFSAARYKACVFMCCQAVDVFLKQKLSEIDPLSEYEEKHEFVPVYSKISSVYKSKTDLAPIMRKCRKYYRESGYSGRSNKVDPAVYTKEFAQQFLGYVKAVKAYIDNECSAGFQGLIDKYGKNAPKLD